MKKIRTNLLPILLLSLLTACNPQTLQNAPLFGVLKITPTGGNIASSLEEEYRSLALLEGNIMQDMEDAAYFNRKAQRAGRGEAVAPDQVADRDIPAYEVTELQRARAELLEALIFSRPGPNNILLARAQVRFDCWLAQREENRDQAYVPACRTGFYEALERIDRTLQETGESKEIDEDRYVVYFDYNSASLNSLARTVIKDMAGRHEDDPSAEVVLSGFSDGPDNEYNRKLADRRVIAVKNSLILYGIPPEHIIVAENRYKPRDQKDPSQPIDPKDRRVDVMFRVGS
ncbi:MAG: OmpA family protein [Rhodospirillales bacterium]|nr:OmpA family protein [Rhodospirillales bacterium]